MTKDEEALKMALEALGDIARARSSGFGIDYAEGYATTTIKQLRKALAEPDMPIDRGNWSGVPDASKWVDELRGGDDFEEPPNSTTDVVEPETEELLTLEEQREAQQQLENHLDAVYQRNNQAFLAQAQLGQSENTQAQELFGKTEQLEAEIKRLQEREWVELTDEEIAQAVGSPLDEVYLADFRKVEARLKEKNV